MRMSNLTDIVVTHKSITTSGTPEQITSTATALGAGVVTAIKAKDSNTGLITIGNSSANALNTSTANWPLNPGESISVQINDLSRIWADCTVSGETVIFMYER